MATLAQRGTGTPVTSGTTWTTTTNAVDGAAGTNPATYAVWTSVASGAVAYIEVTGYNFAAIADTATLNSVTVSLRHFENNITRIASVTFQAYAGATPLGSAATATRSLTAVTDSATFPVTLTQLKAGTFKVRATATRAAVTQSATFNVDHLDVTADYTPLAPKQGSATTAHTWAPTAVGSAPEPVAAGTRVLEDAVARALEDGAARALESQPAAPNDGTAATTYNHAVTAAGKRTPEATATATWTAATTAAGKRTPRATASTTYSETPTAAGKRTPKGAATTSHTWTPTAAGVTPAVGVKQGTATTSWLEAPTAAGKRTPKAAATTGYTETVTAAGRKLPRATATTAHLWTPTAQGVKPTVGVKQGTALAAHLWTPTAAGKRTPRATATVTWLEAPSSTGKRSPKAAAITVHLWVLHADGIAAGPGSIYGQWNGHTVIQLQWGADPVIAYQLVPT